MSPFPDLRKFAPAPRDLRDRKTKLKDLRQMAMELSYRYSNCKQKEIGVIFGVDYSTVTQSRAHLRAKLKSNRKGKNVIYLSLCLSLVLLTSNLFAQKKLNNKRVLILHSYEFLLKYRDTLFIDTPVVFCGVNFFKERKIAHEPC
jgi:DNA-binding CsgD family transcriptional regulator